MKSITILFLAFFSVATFAQKDFQGKAMYMFKRTVDMEQFGNELTEVQKQQMAARFKSFNEKSFTLLFTKSESSFKEDAKLETPGTNGPMWGRNNGQGSIYKSLKDKEMIEDVEQFSKRFLIVEKMEQPQWQLTSETKQIGNYTVYKATMTKEDKSIDFGSIFGRRNNTQNSDKKNEPKMINVTAWYSPQIPVSAGPESYWGLPGLILELNYGRTTLLCTEIVLNPEEKIEIQKPNKGDKVGRDEYNKIIKEKTDELKERFQGRGNGGRGRF
ncbi:MAG: GLPGLI family protein [Flavobacteriia bacterium]|nr:GLPGLI family protein [Flavobacteriia bacterium]OIP45700.1 MAG: ribonuclease Z [Flavobacteriaceae bacterium CG2_30_31_66]PIV97135.1 MAG: GLPGLI family protein [Flavobacteriaceae bacterium CG17_big_fil_post_rev_8_21_14_2_50_31_13]PIX11439.1 MAG: GLPGLI family protein [Flavobacteriaceae bacterium CG_4_8_14_3_um_filter_31_8]PIY14854.1 MAG: GLPGLI family protein [Flavobacteriaceae bacterium CG_4_10_14_3_um_filter_31_253]PIZ09581.1 MAG: GLPGLI family protein [Flavobacteriaceae bacterium CG_4_10_